MELEIAFIRHGQANPSRLIGVTDMPLDEAAKQYIEAKRRVGAYPDAALVYSSGLSRCFETARLIYEKTPIIVLNGSRAMDYGDFDGMTFAELSRNKEFVMWASSASACACPNGEEPYALMARSIATFRKICDEAAGKGLDKIAFVTHRTVIQAVFQRYLLPRSSYSDYEIAQGGGCVMRYDTVFATGKIISKF